MLESFARRIQLICRELKLVVDAIKDYDRQIAGAFAAHPDREIFCNLPGAGPTLAPRLLAGVGARRERFAKAAALQHYSGIALARQLAIDLWRWRTGRCMMKELGWVAA